MASPLTPKQARFVDEYTAIGNASEAYKRAYDASRMSAAAVNVEASRLLGNPKVALRLAELQERAAEKAAITTANVLESVAAIAFAQDGVRVADKLRALELLGRHLNLFNEKVDIRSVQMSLDARLVELGIDPEGLEPGARGQMIAKLAKTLLVRK